MKLLFDTHTFIKRWRGFLPYRVDALEFQLQIRVEWDGRIFEAS